MQWTLSPLGELFSIKISPSKLEGPQFGLYAIHYTWMFPKIVVPPKSSILMGFSIINHPFWGTPIFGNTHIYHFPSNLKIICWTIPPFHGAIQPRLVQPLGSTHCCLRFNELSTHPKRWLVGGGWEPSKVVWLWYGKNQWYRESSRCFSNGYLSVMSFLVSKKWWMMDSCHVLIEFPSTCLSLRKN